MDTSLHDLITRTFATVEAKDLDAIMSVFADDAVVIDPHFPTSQMQGKVAITEGFQEAITRGCKHTNRTGHMGSWDSFCTLQHRHCIGQLSRLKVYDKMR
jgi:ketosteroid isomerase-like protein